MFAKLQNAREEKMIVKRVPLEKKEEMTKDSKSKSHRKTVEKTVKRKREVLEDLYPPNKLTYGEKKKARKEKKGKDKREENKENKDDRIVKMAVDNVSETPTKEPSKEDRLCMLKILMSDLDTSSIASTGNVEPAVSLSAEEEGFTDEEVVIPHITLVSPIQSPELPNTI